MLGTDFYNYSDGVFEVSKNLTIRKNVTGEGDAVELNVGLGTVASYLTMQQGYDINLVSLSGNVGINALNSVNLITPTTTVSNDLRVTGKLTCLNLGSRAPIYFTTNRSINLNGVTFSCYVMDLSQYTNSLLLDGYHVRQFRIRTWLSDGDFSES